MLAGLALLSALVAYFVVLPEREGPGVFALPRPAAAAVRFGLLSEFLRCAYLGFDGRSPSRITTKAPALTASAMGERVALVTIGSFAAVVSVAWLTRIPLEIPGLVGTTAAVASCVGAFQLLGSSLRFLPERYRRWGRTGLTSLVAVAIAAVVWQLATANPSHRIVAAADFAVFGRIWGLFPPVAWVERTVSTYAEFGRLLPATYAPYAALAVAAALRDAARRLAEPRPGTRAD